MKLLFIYTGLFCCSQYYTFLPFVMMAIFNYHQLRLLFTVCAFRYSLSGKLQFLSAHKKNYHTQSIPFHSRLQSQIACKQPRKATNFRIYKSLSSNFFSNNQKPNNFRDPRGLLRQQRFQQPSGQLNVHFAVLPIGGMFFFCCRLSFSQPSSSSLCGLMLYNIKFLSVNTWSIC